MIKPIEVVPREKPVIHEIKPIKSDYNTRSEGEEVKQQLMKQVFELEQSMVKKNEEHQQTLISLNEKL
jgi:hypothetical protein